MRTDRAFTLIEVLIVLALLSFGAALGLIAATDMLQRSSAAGERDRVVALLDRARSHSMDNISAAAHGFCIDAAANAYVVFRAPYAPDRVEETAPHAGSITLSGIPTCGSGREIVFAALSGTTTLAALTFSTGTGSYEIDLNQEGAILW